MEGTVKIVLLLVLVSLNVGVGSASSAWSTDGVDESSVVLQTTLSTAGGLLLLLLLVHLRGLTLHLTGTSQRTVDLTTEQSEGDINVGAIGETLANELIILKRATIVVQDLLLGGDRLGLLEVLLQGEDHIVVGALHGVGAIKTKEDLHGDAGGVWRFGTRSATEKWGERAFWNRNRAKMEPQKGEKKQNVIRTENSGTRKDAIYTPSHALSRNRNGWK